MGERRGPHREGHLALAKKYLGKACGYFPSQTSNCNIIMINVSSTSIDSGDIIAAGAFTPALEGAMFLFKGKSKIEEFVRNDAYNVAGLVSAYKIKDWSVPIGAENLGL
jgi:hypothetical protein